MASARENFDWRLAAVQQPDALLQLQPTARSFSPATMRLGFRTVDGVRVRYAESEGPPERTIVLTSPWPESIYAFAPIWPSLARRFRLFAVDLPGFGASERRDHLLSPRAMGSFLVRLIAECELGRPHIVGPDVGTSAALFAADHSPASVASVVVGCGAVAVPIQLGEPLRSWALGSDLDRVRSLDSRAIVNAALDTVEGHSFPARVRDDYLQSYAGDRFAESMRYVRRYPDELPVLAQRLPEIKTPALVFAGVHDRVVPLANAEFLTAGLPHSQLATISAGHFVWEEAPDAFSTMITNWVADRHSELDRSRAQ